MSYHHSALDPFISGSIFGGAFVSVIKKNFPKM